jgi:dihydroflavonol-4-reductase
MRALVTGANGHIGNHVVRAALSAGHEPIAFVREGSDARALSGLAIERRTGDLLDAGSVERAMQGVELVFHVGAVHRNFDPDQSRIERPAIDGTRHVLEAARRLGVRRVVYTSTAATIGFAKDVAHPLDETSRLQQPHSAYIRGKVSAEQIALEHAQRGGLEVVILNPSGVFRPLDYRATPATRSIIGLLQGDPAFLDMCMTDVRDVARAHLLAAERGRSGERYLCTGDNLSAAQVSALFAQVTGIKPSQMRPPTFVLRLMGRMLQRKARRDGGDTPFDPAALDDLAGGGLVYDSTKARTELGATFRAPPEVLLDAVRWLLHINALKPAVAAKLRAKLGAAAAPDPDWPRA